MRMPIPLTAVLVLALTAVPALTALPTLTALPAHAADAPQVLPMTARVRDELARLYQRDHNPGHFRRLVVERAGAHLGRVGGRYYAVMALWYRDSPTKSTDAGTAFTRRGTAGRWAVGVADGAYDPCARPAPERLMRAWGMRVAHCSGAGRWRFLSGDGQAR